MSDEVDVESLGAGDVDLHILPPVDPVSHHHLLRQVVLETLRKLRQRHLVGHEIIGGEHVIAALGERMCERMCERGFICRDMGAVREREG